MRPNQKIFLGALILAGWQFGLSSCVTGACVGTGVYCGPHRDPWFYDDPWMDGHRWYGEPRGEVGIGDKKPVTPGSKRPRS